MAFTANYLQTVTYAARIDRTLFDNLWTEGILGTGSLLVSERGAGTNMTVDVAAGVAVVEGDDQVFQGKYLCREQAATTGLVITAAPGSGTRHDLVVLRVNDTNAGGPSGDNAVLAVIAGAGGDSTDPATPDSALVLARVRVATSTTAITDAMIDDLRVVSQSVHDPGVGTSLATPSTLMRRDASGRVRVAAPADTADATTKAYVDDLFAAEVDGSWTDPTLATGWAVPTLGRRLSVRLLGAKTLLISGGARRTGGTATSSTICTLPNTGLRPNAQILVDMLSTSEGTLEPGAILNTNGTLQANEVVTGTAVHFSAVVRLS